MSAKEVRDTTSTLYVVDKCPQIPVGGRRLPSPSVHHAVKEDKVRLTVQVM